MSPGFRNMNEVNILITQSIALFLQVQNNQWHCLFIQLSRKIIQWKTMFLQKSTYIPPDQHLKLCSTILSIMAGMSSLFPEQMPVMDRVKIIIQRQKNNYFKNWCTQELDDADVCHITRPLQDITDNIFK